LGDFLGFLFVGGVVFCFLGLLGDMFLVLITLIQYIVAFNGLSFFVYIALPLSIFITVKYFLGVEVLFFVVFSFLVSYLRFMSKLNLNLNFSVYSPFFVLGFFVF
jgi:hypothetical protein